MQSLELQLQQNCVQQQLEALLRQLELLEVEKKDVEARLKTAEKKNEELESRGGGRNTHTHRVTTLVEPSVAYKGKSVFCSASV